MSDQEHVPAPQGTYTTQSGPGSSGAATYAEDDPRFYTANIRRMIQGLINELRQDVQRVDEPRARALFETSAEVLNGLLSAYDHYEQAEEPAWR